MRPFSLPSGAYVPAGNLIAIPQQAISQSPHVYDHPTTFDPYRFRSTQAKHRNSEAVTKYTDVNYSHFYWGSPRKAW